MGHMTSKLPQYGIQQMEIGNNAERAAVELSSMALGGKGFTVVNTSSAISATDIEYFALVPLTTVVIQAIEYASYCQGDPDIVGISIPVGVPLYAGFKSVSLTSGTALAYFSIDAKPVNY